MDVRAVLGGLAGAGALTLLNEGARRIDKRAPRLDVLGMTAFNRMLNVAQVRRSSSDMLFPLSLANNLAGNTIYYSLAKAPTKRQAIIRGTLLGLGAGLAMAMIPEKLKLNEETTAKTAAAKVMTVLWYTLGGLAAGTAMSLFIKK